jgi:hypothetical protein
MLFLSFSSDETSFLRNNYYAICYFNYATMLLWYREHTAPLFKQLKILPFDELIKYSILKFMHSFTHNLLPLSFHCMWTSNRERLPVRLLRNADKLYIVPLNYATLKRMPLFNFPNIWNQETDEKHNPINHRYLKNLKRLCLLNHV